MDHVEVAGAARVDLVQHGDMVRGGIYLGVEENLVVDHRLKLGGGGGVSGGEERHIVPQLDERLGEIGDHSLGPAVFVRGNGYLKWHNLRDPHLQALLLLPLPAWGRAQGYHCGKSSMLGHTRTRRFIAARQTGYSPDRPPAYIPVGSFGPMRWSIGAALHRVEMRRKYRSGTKGMIILGEKQSE